MDSMTRWRLQHNDTEHGDAKCSDTDHSTSSTDPTADRTAHVITDAAPESGPDWGAYSATNHAASRIADAKLHSRTHRRARNKPAHCVAYRRYEWQRRRITVRTRTVPAVKCFALCRALRRTVTGRISNAFDSSD
jgi:hypothetical protein